MKIDARARIKICPRCGNAYHGAPALSRRDNKTLLCPDCGTREALESIGVEKREQDEIGNHPSFHAVINHTIFHTDICVDYAPKLLDNMCL